jgi:adenosylcobinamide-GDP ribazoletransferase
MAWQDGDAGDWRDRGTTAAGSVLRCLRFYSRLPVPTVSFEPEPHGPPDVRTMARVLPLAGALIGLVPALVLVLGLALDLGPWLSAALALAALTVATGAMHEDGLADTADGFGGGATEERRLAIMRDSRIGSFGAVALILGFALRIAALATLAERLDPAAAAAAILLAAALSRTAGLIVLGLLAPARADGASHAFGRPTSEDLWSACAIAGTLTLLVGLLSGLPVIGLVLMTLLPAAAAYGITRLADRLIGGQTGDVVGAAQSLAEIACLIGLLIAVPR